jgi:hypothetical protein
MSNIKSNNLSYWCVVTSRHHLDTTVVLFLNMISSSNWQVHSVLKELVHKSIKESHVCFLSSSIAHFLHHEREHSMTRLYVYTFSGCLKSNEIECFHFLFEKENKWTTILIGCVDMVHNFFMLQNNENILDIYPELIISSYLFYMQNFS